MSLVRSSKPSSHPAAFQSTVIDTDRGGSDTGSGSGTTGRRSTRTSEPGEDRLEGADLDHFHVEAPLGRGGMGVVYAARDRSLDRAVAIKVLPDELLGQPELEARFIREARAQARLASARVVHIYHIGHIGHVGQVRPAEPAPDDERGSLYFAMERVEGGSLEEPLTRGERMDPERARRLMVQVAEGLRDAQRAGIIHRDIKPSNLLCTKDGDVKIADFGLAKPLDGDAQITREGSLVGSPLYIAPEQARGENVDHRADMYALGGTFYHLLTGAPPFDGPTPLSIVTKHLTDRAPRLRDRNPDVPPRLAAIVERLMAKEPANRFATYDALLVALEDAAPDGAPAAGFWARAASVSVDFLVAGVMIGLLGWPAAVVNVLYVTIAHGYWGQTLGKYLFRLRVLRIDGERLGVKRAALRTAASMWLPILVGLLMLVTQGKRQVAMSIERLQPAELDALKTLIIAIAVGNVLLSLAYVAGFLLAAFHPKKRALHDLVSGSQVVYRL